MQAEVLPNLRTYRSFKFPWHGVPTRPPDVYSSVDIDAARGHATTSVHVSWNGQTDGTKWNFYSADAISGEKTRKLATVLRRGFETSYMHRGFLRDVIVEAVDLHDQVLGTSLMTKTIISANAQGHPLLQDESEAPTRSISFVCGAIFGVLALAMGKLVTVCARTRGSIHLPGARFTKRWQTATVKGWPWAQPPREMDEELEHLAKYEGKDGDG